MLAAKPSRMNPIRRSLIAALAALGLAPAAGLAQGAVRRVAWFGVGSPDTELPYLDALRASLGELGWQEGRNLQIQNYRSTRAPEDFEAIVGRIVEGRPEVVVCQEFATLAMQRYAPGLPVVFGFSGDPVEANLVRTLARPGTSFTGMSYLASALVGKRIEFLKEALPGIRRIAILARPQHPGEHREREASEEAARKLGVAVSYFPILNIEEIEPAFKAMQEAKVDALVVFPDFIMFMNRQKLARLALEARLPAISGWSSFAESGMLFNYGPNLRDIYRELATYVDRILRGAKPHELPVEFPRTIELIVNLRTARTLGLKVPQPILVRADRVIE